MFRFLIPTTLSLLFVVAAWGQTTKDVKNIKGWPQWRGPNRDAVSTDTGLLKEWPKDGPKLLWETNGLGKGYSSIVLAGGKGTAKEKFAALEKAGVRTVRSLADLGEAMATALK